ncbi:MAG: hypothetical protein M3525_13615 [Acidobacteriota bacterium]|nr:hypothetical protein [Acidobacteriota bacterium]
MDEKQDAATEENRQSEPRRDTAVRESGIGTGRKVGLYGCAFLVAAFVIMIIVLIITGMYAPFPSNEGVGP